MNAFNLLQRRNSAQSTKISALGSIVVGNFSKQVSLITSL